MNNIFVIYNYGISVADMYLKPCFAVSLATREYIWQKMLLTLTSNA